ncbi:leukocyte cysteine proteinase inhibitor 1-like [Monodelphis domestica]|uniref:leukocyte cysteine proteinase inhibitor 1-like n=1 Tax=Monodelphis domestica TaxID=13616 RepID=UPI0024E216D0|nr:leukocyte cysteine proteinase inhibitor 1-like [Monodelphis domestica]
MMAGGLSEARPATEEIQKKVDQVKSQFQKKSNVECTEFKAESYKTQVVAGTIYYVKVHIGNNKYIHMKILEPLTHADNALELLDYQCDKTKDDELVYF